MSAAHIYFRARMRSLAVRLLTLALLTLTSHHAYAAITAVKDGQPQAVIVTAEKPGASAQHAAEELQHFIELMSGAKLPIQTDAVPVSGPALLVGRSKLTAGLEIPAGVDRDFSR